MPVPGSVPTEAPAAGGLVRPLGRDPLCLFLSGGEVGASCGSLPSGSRALSERVASGAGRPPKAAALAEALAGAQDRSVSAVHLVLLGSLSVRSFSWE